MSEGRLTNARRGILSGLLETDQSDSSVKGETPERYNHTKAVEHRDLSSEKRPAVLDLFSQRLVRRGRAMDDCGDIAVLELQAVAEMNRRGLIGESRSVQGAIKPVAASIAGEDSPRAIAPMSGGSQPDYQQTRTGVAKARHWLSPVVIARKAPDLLSGDLLAPLDQPRTARASDHLCL